MTTEDYEGLDEDWGEIFDHDWDSDDWEEYFAGPEEYWEEPDREEYLWILDREEPLGKPDIEQLTTAWPIIPIGEEHLGKPDREEHLGEPDSEPDEGSLDDAY